MDDAALKRRSSRGFNHGKKKPAGLLTTEGSSDYSDEEAKWLRAVDQYRRLNGRGFLLATEYLFIARAMGYRRVVSGKE